MQVNNVGYSKFQAIQAQAKNKDGKKADRKKDKIISKDLLRVALL